MVKNPLFTVLVGGIITIMIGAKYLMKAIVIPDTSFHTDFTSIFAYFSDILLVFALIYSLIKRIWPNKLVIPLVLWLTFQIYFIVDPKILPIYYGTRLILVLFLFGLLSKITLDKRKTYIIAASFSILGAVQALIAYIQFILKHSVGLSLLGESPLDLFSNAIATFYVHGEKIIRAYGTFPHPNVLSAFLITSTLLNLYLLNKTIHRTTWYFWITTFLMNLIGLLLTFSRSGILFGLISAQILIITMFWRDFPHNKARIIFVQLALIVSALIFTPYLSSRATISGSATNERTLFNEIAIKIIKDNGLTGVGMGNAVFHMKQYSHENLKPWDYQPIHNYYLLAISELGLGAMVIFYLLGNTIKKTATKFWAALKNREESFMWNITLLLIMSCFLLMNLFDHYFYTLPQGLLLFWMVASLCNMETVDE